MKALLPYHILASAGTTRNWRKRKRAELSRAIRAMEEVLLGAAYTPSLLDESGQFVDALIIYELMKDLRKKWSVKEWGR